MNDTPAGPVLRRSVAGLIGLLAAAFALAVGHLVAALIQPNSSPYLAVGNTAIDFTPEPVKAFAIRTFGESDKVALLVGMAVVIALVAVLAGLLSRRSPRPGTVVIGLFGVIGVAAALWRPDLGVLGVLPSAVAAFAGAGAFSWLHSVALRATAAPNGADSGPDAGEDSTHQGRRRVLVSTAAVAAGAGVAGLGGQLLSRQGGVEASRQALAPPRNARPAPKIPQGADFARVGTPTFITPNADFYRIDTALSVPQIRPEDWQLRVHGMVDRELTLGYEDLKARNVVERTITMTCVSNEVGGPYISTANFVGVPIRDVLAEAGVRAGAEQVFSTSEDGYTAGTPVEVLTDPNRDALLAIGMNDEPLPAQHGFPVRMVVPGLYGFVSATKWVVDLELTTFDKQTYWEERGWAERAPIKTQSRIDSPGGFDQLPAGRTTVAGIAWAQHTGIDRVEVRADGGPWQQAQLSTEVNTDTWRMWRVELDLAPGGHTLECRATDRSGYTQTPERVGVIPDGATGWHSVFVTAT
ncbi:molybdopterin-dependent oxidoreductase [Allosaccharopolyspora coralli]|uniref:Molybdopterin-dependent oxidoreductase n=1 Tax=Allosaccharopolyspora coralli TaxID=2665642 RepID=A0A5Q3Q9Q5_9PSEU|nr:molybdopterin-dependent oxidoreductase [Allosaccharopolyspora coralli]QGK70076.1 molybdopterin-dependent oxidoreductase [Allosaccharopolyspora coralli]